MLGKISLVYFWGYVGVSLIEALKNPSKLIGVVILIVIVYIISYILSKNLKLNKIHLKYSAFLIRLSCNKDRK